MTNASPSRAFIPLLVAITAIGPMAMQIFIPALPAIQEGFGISTGLAQLTFSLSAIAIAVATLAYGPFSDHLGRRPVLLFGLGVFIVGSVVAAVATSIWMLIVGRIVQAAGGAAGMVVSRAMVRDLFEREQSARIFAYLTMAMVTVPMVSPALGGLLTDSFSWRANFATMIVVGVILTFAVALYMEETHDRPGTTSGGVGMLRSFGRLLGSPAFCGYAFQGTFSLCLFFSFLAGAPYYMVRILGRDATEYGLYFILVAGSFMLGNFAAARLTARFGLDRMIVRGSVLALVGATTALVLGIAGIWTPLALYLPTTFTAFAQGLSMPNAQAGAISVDPSMAGSAAGLSGFLSMFIAAVVAQIVGQMQDGTPYAMLAFMTGSAAMALVSIVLGLKLERRADATPA